MIVDDDAEMCQLLERALGPRLATRSTTDPTLAWQWLQREEFGAVIVDVRMPKLSGLQLCERVTREQPEVPVIVATAFGSMETAVVALRAGAYDFLTKPFELEVVRLAVDRALEHRSLTRRVNRLEQVVRQLHGPKSMIGASTAMQRLGELISRVAAANTAVLIHGESGTGKELVARAIHELSPRAAGPFVAVNCAAMPETLLESELFGHARGAFTDARNARVGLFQQAEGGTLFLDEIAELPLGLQPKLLRALQERVVRPLGASKELAFDARVVTATNRDLEAAVADGSFREDLYYRIQVIQIDVPPLRSRGNDILMLAQHFTERFCREAGRSVARLEPEAAERLLAYRWPGNVRELQNCIERAVTLGRGERIGLADLPDKLKVESPSAWPAGNDPAELPTMDEVERRYVLQVFDAVGGNKSAAAKVLGFNRKTLYRKLRQYGLAGDDEDPPGD